MSGWHFDSVPFGSVGGGAISVHFSGYSDGFEMQLWIDTHAMRIGRDGAPFAMALKLADEVQPVLVRFEPTVQAFGRTAFVARGIVSPEEAASLGLTIWPRRGSQAELARPMGQA